MLTKNIWLWRPPRHTQLYHRLTDKHYWKQTEAEVVPSSNLIGVEVRVGGVEVEVVLSLETTFFGRWVGSWRNWE